MNLDLLAHKVHPESQDLLAHKVHPENRFLSLANPVKTFLKLAQESSQK